MKPAFLLLWVLLGGCVSALAEDIRPVRLHHGQASTSDGFHVQIVAESNSLGVERYGSLETLFLHLEVPQTVGKADFSGCQLVVRDKQDHTLLAATLGTRKGEGKQTQHADVTVQRAYASYCEVEFFYTARPLTNIVAKYIVPITGYLPAAR